MTKLRAFSAKFVATSRGGASDVPDFAPIAVIDTRRPKDCAFVDSRSAGILLISRAAATPALRAAYRSALVATGIRRDRYVTCTPEAGRKNRRLGRSGCAMC